MKKFLAAAVTALSLVATSAAPTTIGELEQRADETRQKIKDAQEAGNEREAEELTEELHHTEKDIEELSDKEPDYKPDYEPDDKTPDNDGNDNDGNDNDGNDNGGNDNGGNDDNDTSTAKKKAIAPVENNTCGAKVVKVTMGDLTFNALIATFNGEAYKTLARFEKANGQILSLSDGDLGKTREVGVQPDDTLAKCFCRVAGTIKADLQKQMTTDRVTLRLQKGPNAEMKLR